MALIPPSYIDCVVAIGVEKDDQKKWIGTGFLFGNIHEITDDNNNKYLTYLVTNKHVLKDLENIIIRFNPQTNQSSKDYSIKLKNTDETFIWTGHPNKDIDVAVIQVQLQVLIKEGMKFKFFQSDKEE